MTLSSDQFTVVVIAVIFAVVVVAILAPASLGVLLKSVESLIEKIGNVKSGDNTPRNDPK